jgi:hypothetical protein
MSEILLLWYLSGFNGSEMILEEDTKNQRHSIEHLIRIRIPPEKYFILVIQSQEFL